MTKPEIDLIDEKFKGLTTLMNAQFQNIHERLDEIKEQTTKTNGRVTQLEKQDLTHVLRCPQTAKIDQINKDLEDYRFIIKYPKVFIAGLVVVVLLTLATFIESKPFKFLVKEPTQTEQTK